MKRNAWNLAILTCLLIGTSLCGGCARYTLRGKVVEGSTSSIALVHEIDQRFKQPGLANAEVLVHRDAESPDRRLVGRAYSGPGGDFSIGINDFGAAWMQEQWRIQGVMHGKQNAESMMRLPPKNSKWRILITLAPGESTPADRTGISDARKLYD